MVVISNSHDSEKDLDYSFYIPFQKSAEYLGMQYIGNKHINADNPKELNNIELAFL
nr:hypothetical protein [Flavobacterium covae]